MKKTEEAQLAQTKNSEKQTPQEGAPLATKEATSEAASGVAREARGAEAIVWLNPAVDIYSDKEATHIEAEAPGAHEKSVKVTVEKGVLTLEAQSDRAEFPASGAAGQSGRGRVSGYKRSFQLGDEVDQEGIEARVKEGVIHLRIPRRAPRSISVEVKAG